MASGKHSKHFSKKGCGKKPISFRPSAAVPQYLGRSFDNAPPGHRFRLYLDCWDRRRGWKRADKSMKRWELKELDHESQEAVKAVSCVARSAAVPAHTVRLISECIDRQKQLMRGLGDMALHIEAKSTDCFVTGLGNEHPLENGFYFADPYGIPCLPGSSVKGAIRRAAEELIFFDNDSEWTFLDLIWLFGFDASAVYIASPDKKTAKSEDKSISQERLTWVGAYDRHIESLSEHRLLTLVPLLKRNFGRMLAPGYIESPRSFLLDLPKNKGLQEGLRVQGAVQFWDVYPHCSGSTGMKVEIMNPHFPKYYGSDGSNVNPPHDGDNPIPIPYLAVSKGQTFDFCTSYAPPSVVPREMAGRWRDLMEQAFEHCFEWGGFGAKTSQGFGSMERIGGRGK